MTFRLRQIEQASDGREIVRVSNIDRSTLTLGRAAENDVRVPDLAVELHHADILRADDTHIEIKAADTLAFDVDGDPTLFARIDCRVGAELRFGTYRIKVSLDEDGATLLTIRQVEEKGIRSGNFNERNAFALASVLPSKRMLAWVTATIVLLVFLLVPVISQQFHAAHPASKIVGDGSWSPGKLSVAHHTLEERCEACHVKPFESVRNETCQSCHKTAHDHAPAARMSMARANPPLGTMFLQAVAKGFGREDPGGCVDCHNEHRGLVPMALPQQQFCADCHGALSSLLTDTKLGNAGDFSKQHPQFAPRIVTNPDTRSLTRVSLDARPRETSGLTFSHRLHLDPQGGVARMAASIGSERGYGLRLECKNCHHPSEEGVRFRPISMERDCEGCHSLVYDKVGDIFRTLHHGKVDQMIADLSAASPHQPVVTGRRRPGEFGPGGAYYSNFAPPSGGGLIGRAMSRDGICGECHTPTTLGGKLSVVPVTLISRYMANGWFDHRAHSQTPCASCHAASGSTNSADVMLPGIAVCRTCHAGQEATGAKVPSGCAMCHRYHPPNVAQSSMGGAGVNWPSHPTQGGVR